MTIDDILGAVRTAHETDFEKFDLLLGPYDEFRVLKSNPSISIRRLGNDSPSQTFEEDWIPKSFHGPSYRMEYYICWGETPIKYFILVAVDGHRANLPLPDQLTKSIPREKYDYAKAVGDKATLDEYVKRSKLAVES